MYHLYAVKRMSIAQIAKLFGCSPETVRRWLIKFGIERRPVGPLLLEPNLTLSSGLVHLVFALKGDGNVRKYGGNYRIQFCSTDKVLAESVQNDLTRIGLHSKITGPYVSHEFKNHKPIYRLEATSKLFAQYYLSLTTQDLLGLGLAYLSDALRGFLETEGNVHYDNYNSLHVTVITNTDLNLIHVARDLASKLGYETSIYKSGITKGKNPKPYYQLYLLGTTLEKEAFLNKLNPCIKWLTEKPVHTV